MSIHFEYIPKKKEEYSSLELSYEPASGFPGLIEENKVSYIINKFE
jgi:hypothetical protein